MEKILDLKNKFKKKIKNKFKNAEIISFFKVKFYKIIKFFLMRTWNISLFEKEKIFFIENTNDKILSLIKIL